jgi:replicative DNA helicase
MTDLVDMAAEQAVIGSCLLSDKAANAVLDMGLRPHHFANQGMAELFNGVYSLGSKAKPIDPITLRGEIERMGTLPVEMRGGLGLADYIDEFTGAVPLVGNVKAYAERVLELAKWRDLRDAAHGMVTAAQERDAEKWSHAMATLESAGTERKMDSLSGEEWASTIFDYLSRAKEDGFIPLPFSKLSDAMGGGLRPGEVCLVAGYTNHGKSVFADQWLDTAVKHKRRAHLYMTEMTAQQRGLRYLTRETGIPYAKLRRRNLDPDERARIVKVLGRQIPYGVSIVADWDIEDVVRDALRAKWDFIVIDLIHGFHYQDERGLDRLSKAAQRLARASTTRGGYEGTAVVLVAHLSNVQMRESKSAKRPMPGLHSIKGATSLGQDSDFVVFVWQEDDENGTPSGIGKIYIPKARSGAFTTVDVDLNMRKFRFEAAGIGEMNPTMADLF